jgi:hypothetical protein
MDTISLPILIGSYALYNHGISNNYADIDLILDQTIAKDLSWKCIEKKGKMLFFEIPKSSNLKAGLDIQPISIFSNQNLFQSNQSNQSKKKNQNRSTYAG